MAEQLVARLGETTAADRGTVFAEYLVVMLLVTVGLGLATYALGPKLYGVFAYQRMVLSAPLL